MVHGSSMALTLDAFRIGEDVRDQLWAPLVMVLYCPEQLLGVAGHHLRGLLCARHGDQSNAVVLSTQLTNDCRNETSSSVDYQTLTLKWGFHREICLLFVENVDSYPHYRIFSG